MNENVEALLDEKLVDDEEMLMQGLLLQEVENIPIIELAQSVVQRSATKLRSKRFKEQIEFFSVKLCQHMTETVPSFSKTFDYVLEYFKFLDKYMFDFVSTKLCWNTELNRDEMEQIVCSARNKLNRCEIKGWTKHYKDNEGNFTT